MAAFSYQHHPFLLDSVFLQNFPSKVSGFSEEPNSTTTPCFSQFYHPALPLQDISPDVSSCLEHSTTKISPTNNETTCVTINKQNTDSSSVILDKLESGEQVTQKVMVPMDKKRKYKHGSSLHSAHSKDTREVKSKKQKKSKGGMKNDEEKKGRVEKKVYEEAPNSYIHVRARRGQATDSHSLAERVRREKISERMKLLQSLVPGCDKVTGKALMLDEIINYVQSLQNQVEFLSMKLASVNPMFYDFGMDLDAFMVKPERMISLESQQPNVQKCNPTQATAFSDTINTFATANNSYPILDSSFLFQHGQIPNILSQVNHFQSNGHVLWDVDDQRQKIINQRGFTNDLCSFH